ncbi:MAG: prepilin peptidase [Deltaproteobacteria bacterium]|nr:prepilin peptidase [Deltaproteobacteria bacterium]
MFSPHTLFFILSGVLGALIGSFLNVCIWRLPREESIVRPRSQCPHCLHRLAWWENIPLLSFLFLRGRCRGCRKPISWQYPLVEALTAGFSWLTWWHTQDPLLYAVYFLLFIAPLIVLSFIDLKCYLLPDVITLPGIVAGLAVHTFFGPSIDWKTNFFQGLLGAAVGGGILFLLAVDYEKIKKQEGLGGGDIKLIAMLGAFFGWQAVLLILFASSLVGLVVGIAGLLFFKRSLQSAIPYGPFLSLAGILYFFWGKDFLNWYLGLF